MKTQRCMLALLVAALVAGCQSGKTTSPAAANSAPVAKAPAYPARPTVAPPPFKVFHQDEDTYTLVTKEDASEDEIAALLWQLRDAAETHGFDKLHLSQKFIDARAPKIWFHVYRGAKCANEKFTTKAYPCGAKYNGAGDLTLGSFKNPQYEEAVLYRADGSQARLWAPDAVHTK